jgi:Tol biopolymer transport system component
MTRFMLVVVVLAATAVSISTVPSRATFPGENGRIAFRRYLDDAHTRGAIFTIASDGTGEHQVTHPPKGTVDDQPDWAPHGSLIVFERCPRNGSCRLYTINADGSGMAAVSPPCSRGAKCGGDGPAGFSPDGKRIVFGRFDSAYGCCAIATTDLRGHSLSLVTKGVKPYSIGEPQLSPDGRHVVFIEAKDGEKPRAVFIVGVNGRGSRRLTPWSLNAGDAPDWSPDGKWILFRSNVDIDGKQSQIYVVHPDGTGLKQVTRFKSGTVVTSSSFSPDGTQIVLGTTGIAGQADLFLMSVDGTGLTPVTRTPMWDSAPDWGPGS